MNIWVNGEPRLLEDGRPALDQALKTLGYEGKHFAVAVNGSFVPRGSYAQLQLQGGEKLEVLSPMQGG